MAESQTAKLAVWIERLRGGDPKASDFLIATAEDRLRRLTRKMLKSFPAVHRWEQTDDVFQNAALRLHRSLANCVPQSVRHFFNLAATNIRRELVDLSRHYSGPEGIAANYTTEPGNKSNSTGKSGRIQASSSTNDPVRLACWSEFHLQVEQLPEQDREIFNLLWYEELPQAEAAKLLGISDRTLQRRWQSARLKLFEVLKGALPT
ncbi:MAG: sigma-70 family RNA polymerase sigma factor [Planctomycetota bacterium]